ncbi:ATP-binding protein [Primorskyibacter sp. S187A]|uniref:ATP-binding protein n=1 Tax=Primorskyibacter sp. S187A TaxID=3415130 RepID=UPI003C7E1D1C
MVSAQQSNLSHQKLGAIAVLLGAFSAVFGVLFASGALGSVLIGAGITILLAGLSVGLRTLLRDRVGTSQETMLRSLIEHEQAICVVTTADGEVKLVNAAALDRLRRDVGDDRIVQAGEIERLGQILELMLASPGGLIHRMRTKAIQKGLAQESVVTRKGQVRLSAQDVGSGLMLWRVEEVSETDLQRAQDGVTLPRVTVGRSGAILFMNDAARRLFGKRAKSLDDLGVGNVAAGAVITVAGEEKAIQCLVAQVDISGARRELFFLPPPKTMTTPPDESGFDTLPVPLLRLSADGLISRANSEALRLLDIQSADNLRLGDVLEGLGRPISDWLDDVVNGRAQNHGEFLRLSNASKERFLQVSLKRVIVGDGVGLVAVLSDATELKTLEAQFVQSQKMQAIGQLAGGVAHDFNNLLTAISGHCDLLLLRHDQGDPDYGDLVQINQNANRAAALVSQLLAFSRKQTLRPELLHLRDTLSDLTHLLNRLVGEKVRLSLNHAEDLRAVRVDKRQLEQVMMNLVVNARDAMPDGGQIDVQTDVVHLKTPLKRDRAVVSPGEYVSVKVSDQGCGIAPDNLQKVFEPFYTTKRAGEGTGLGLSTVYGIIKQTGGFIFVDSVVGQGTCFTLLFPVHDEVVEAEVVEEPVASEALPQQSDAVVLLVEDEAPVRAFASRALRLRGFTVVEAQSAEEALEKLEDPDLKIDVFVTDVVMPGMDGPRWVKQALEQRPGVRVVFVSGYAEESFSEDQTRIPNSVFLPKPFSLSELTDTVQRQLH